MPHRLLVLGLLPIVSPAVAAPMPAPKAQSADSLIDRLAAGTVTDVPPRVLYTWTTPDQISRLAEHQMLLTRTESPTYGQTGFALAATRHAEQTGDAASVLMTRPGFARHRYAWHQPWATVAGWNSESYGDALIGVELKAEAWMGIFDQDAASPWRFVDMQGRAVSVEKVLANPERLGVVLHIKPRTNEYNNPYDTFGWTNPAYREYILCNESMIHKWSTGGNHTTQALSDSQELLTTLRPHLPPAAAAVHWETEIVEKWKGRPGNDPVDLYLHNLAFPNAFYAPGQAEVDTLLARLPAIPKGVAITHKPDATFSLENPPPVPGGVP